MVVQRSGRTPAGGGGMDLTPRALRGRATPRGGVRLAASGGSVAIEEVLEDYRLAVRSRALSVIGRREVLSGNAKFGIFGDGKELVGIAMAKAFRAGDWRSGYYRDQTFALATGMTTVRALFAQLYADADTGREPMSGGRQMNNHFATRFLDEEGRMQPSLGTPNSAADVSCIAGWMPRALGLGYASKLYRQNPQLVEARKGFSRDGDEVAFATIGDAGTSEGLFLETLNAAVVLQVPVVLNVLDDGYGISVPTALQTAKGSISAACRGLECLDDGIPGLRIRVVQGWDYAALCDAYLDEVERVRRGHVPCLLHIVELTQPQGHSSSGSQERYKTPERLAWEREHDCIARMRAWLLAEGHAQESDLIAWEREEREWVEAERAAAEEDALRQVRAERDSALALLDRARAEAPSPELDRIRTSLAGSRQVSRRLVATATVRAALAAGPGAARDELRRWADGYRAAGRSLYRSHLVSEGEASPLRVTVEPAAYAASPETVDGRVVLQRCFDANMARDPRIFVLGEDVGRLGDVNLVFEGLQQRHGEMRVTDTGIREATILGQAIGSAMRGLRPIADIQYLDYFLYALQMVSDDLATLRWRTAGGQAAPVIVRTKGHRLVGIWHAGSPMGTIVHACRGVHVCVPRDMTQAAGMYNTLLRGDDPALVVEVLNAYRLKERVPDNIGTFTVPLGRPEVLRAGADVTVVTYGACCRVALEAADQLQRLGVEAEVIDVQTLTPFDVDHRIAESVERTGAVVFLDEDVPGGASAYMMQQVLEGQGAWWHLDAAPRTVTAAPSRCAYGTDGDYFSKPQVEDVVLAVYDVVSERDPRRLPPLGMDA